MPRPILQVGGAAPVPPADGPKPPHVGRAEERRDLQRSPGLVRQLDEHQPARGDLHLARRRQVLEDARVLRQGVDDQVPQGCHSIDTSNLGWR